MNTVKKNLGKCKVSVTLIESLGWRMVMPALMVSGVIDLKHHELHK
jgi:hypothetical protein